MQFSIKKKQTRKKCINLFNPAPEILRETFPNDVVDELKILVDYWRPEGEIDQLIRSDYFFRELLQEAEIILTGWGTPPLPFDLLSHGSLSYICNVTGSVRHCISKDFLQKGIPVTNWGDAISLCVAEATLMLMLACSRRLGYVRTQLAAGNWTLAKPRPLSLCGQKIGLLGFGHIAQNLVRLLAPFRMRIQVFDPYVSDEVLQQFGVTRVVGLKTLFSENDIVSLHAGMTNELDGAVNADMLKLMPDDGILINTARGRLINEADLLAELLAGRLWCGLDVFAVEPLPPDSPFRFLPRCIITPHTAGPTWNCYREIGEYTVKNIRRFTRGEPLVSQISLEQYDLMT